MRSRNTRKRGRKAWIAVLPVLAIAGLMPASAFAAADVSIQKTDNADPIAENAELIYTLTVTNAGPDDATGVVVEDDLPPGVDFISAVPTQGDCDNAGPNVTCTLGNIADGESATVTIRVRPNKTGELTNTATVESADDANAANNSDTETTVVVEEYGGVLPPTCAGKTATIVGTAGDDNLIGTTGRDVIVGLAGNDTIQGLGGNDIICGNGGNDTIKGQGGKDVLRGGGGNDTVRGGGGNDTVRGGAGDDLLRGGTGDDVLRGGGGDDVLRGGGGDDILRGGGGNDLLLGGGGNDVLRGGAGKDTLRGGGGEDNCRGGGGRDSKRSC